MLPITGESVMISKVFTSQWYLGILSILSVVGGSIASVEAAQIVTANRSSGNISVIDVTTQQVFDVLLPGIDPEPMYVFHIPATGEVAVGDRANNQVVFFDQDSYDVTGTASAGSGIFHMWANPQNTQLWVNNDIEQTISVIDPNTKQLIETVPIPSDIVSQGGIPHDVILDADGFAYVSIFFPETILSDQILKFSTESFAEVDRQDVGKGPHISLTDFNDLLYVPTEGSNEVAVLSRETLEPVIPALSIPGAHGAEMAFDGQTFYTTNISGGGPNGLWAIDTASNTIIGTGVDTPAPAPHNVAVTDDNQLYISHSGATSNVVSFYQINDQFPTFEGTVNIGGFNPFGITYIPSVPDPSSVLGLLTLGIWGAGSLLKNKQ